MREKFAENIENDAAEAKLRRSEERFRLLVETMPGAFAELDVEGRWTYVNKQMGELLGLDPADAIGRSADEFLDEENRQILADEMARRNSGSPRQHEISWTKVSGEIVHGLVSPQVLFDEKGQFRGSFAVITDITLRKRTEERLTKLKAELETRVEERTAELDEAQRIAGLGSWVWNLETNEVRWSKEVARIHGYDEEPRGAHGTYDVALDGVHPDDRDRVHDRVHRAVSDGKGFSIDYRIVLGSGDTRYVHEQGVVVHDSEGKPLRVTGTIQDITESKLIENALRDGESRLAEAQRIAHLGSWFWDIATNKVTSSNELYRIFGYEHQVFDVTYETFLESVHPDDRESLQTEVNRVLQGEKGSIDHRIVLPNGQIRFIHEEGEVTFNDHGDPIRMQGTAQDITDRKRIEEALRQSEMRLEQAQRIAGVGSFEWDMVADTHEWSDEFYRIWGYRRDKMEASYESMLAAVHPEDRGLVQSLADQLSSGEKEASVDYRVVHSSGEVRAVHVEVEMLFGEDGTPLRMWGTALDITERKLAEDALRESGTRLAEAQRQAHLGHWAWDIESNTLTWSDEIYRIIDRIPGEIELTREAFQEVVHPEDREFVDRYVRQAAAGGKTHPIDYRIILPSGEVRFVTGYSELVNDSDGRPIQMTGTFQDVTERKRVEEALRESESRLEAAQRIAHVGSWEWDYKTDDVRWSDETYRIYGMDRNPSRLRRTDARALIHPDDQSEVQAVVERAEKGKSHVFVEYRIIRSTGEVRYVETYAEMSYTEDGEPFQFAGTIYDITERKRFENELRESEERLAHAQRIARIGNWEFDPIEGVIEWSDEMYSIYGVPRGEGHEAWLGGHRIHPEDRVQALQAIAGCVRDRAPDATEFRIVRPDGEVRTVVSLAVPILDDAGNLFRLRGTTQDITERKAVEKELAKYRDHLEELVEERTAALKEVQKELVSKERLATLGQLTGTVSHELRNPLGTIRNSLYSINEMVAKSKMDAGPILDRANRGIDRCDQIIEELLEYTRTRRFEFLPTDIDSWMRSLISEYDFPSDVEVESSFQSGKMIAIDSDRLYRCVINLFANAVQAIAESEDAEAPKKLSIRTKTDGTYVTIEIADSGPGIDPENMDKIFEPLFSTKGFGVGLGLCIVKQTVEGHGGAVTVRSGPEEGTVFTVSIPLESSAVPPV